VQKHTFLLPLFIVTLSLATTKISSAQGRFFNSNTSRQKSMLGSLAIQPVVLNSQQLGSTSGRPGDPTPVSSHEKFATFLSGEDFTSVLLLQNFRPDLPITFHPTLIVDTGEVPVAPVTVPPHSRATLDINTILNQHGLKDTQGTVAIQFDFSSYGPGSAVVQMSDEKHHVYLNSYAQSREEYWSGTQYDAVVWAPTEGTHGFIAVTNASTEPHVVNITFLLEGHAERVLQVEVPPRRTRRVLIDSLLAQSRQNGAGIHIEYEQAPNEEYPGAILVEGQLFNKKTGFGKYIHFMDKALPPTATLRSQFLLLGRQPAEDNFPADVVFRSVAAVHNIENVPVKITPKVRFFRNQKLHTAILPSRLLRPHDSLLIDFDEEQRAGNLPADFTQGSLEITPDTNRPSIVGELFNFSQGGGFVIGPSFTSYPTRSTSSIWRTDGSFQTTIMVENTASTEDQVVMRLFSDQGHYTKSFPLLGGELLKINLRELQQKQIRDDDGNLLAGVSGVMSLVASHGTRSKLSYDKIIHSVEQADYVGLPANSCDFVSSIAMWIDTSGILPFPVMKTYYWTQSGPEDANAFGSTSSNTSWAQISSNSGGDLLTLSFPNDGLVHQVTINPGSPTEDVTFCDACSAGDVLVTPVAFSGRTLPFILDTCTVNPFTHSPAIVASWGFFGTNCALSDSSPPPLPSGGTCVPINNKNCYRVETPTCQVTFCPGDIRTSDSACTRFLDQFPIITSRIPAGCSL
jgi:hypothetical protein